MQIPIVPNNIPISDKDGKLTREWQGFFSNLSLQLQLSFSNGILIPALNTNAINLLINASTQPRLVYNTDTNYYMVYKAGAYINLI